MGAKPVPSQIKKYENRFGQIKSKAHAQELIDLARGSLEERRDELLRELKKRIKLNRLKSNAPKRKILIRSPSGRTIAFAEFYVDDLNSIISIEKISTGGLVADEEFEMFKQEDSLRGLGIGSLTLDRIKQYAAKKNIKYIELFCRSGVMGFYLKNGFVDVGPIFRGAFWHKMRYTIHQ